MNMNTRYLILLVLCLAVLLVNAAAFIRFTRKLKEIRDRIDKGLPV